MSEKEAQRGVFVVGGEDILFPDFGEGFTMDEAMAFYDYTGFPLEDLIVDEDADDDEVERAEKLMRSPHVLSALMHIGYSRAHPKATDAKIRKLVKRTSFVEAFSKMAEAEQVEDADDGPPSVESTSTPSESSTSTPADSENTTKLSPESSGLSSQNGSSEPESHPAPTGPGSSDTSSPVLAPTTSAH